MKNMIRKTHINVRFSAPGRACRRLLSAGISVLLFISTFLAVIPQTEMVVYAGRSNKKSVSGLCTGPIANPTEGGGGWSYVYYGTFRRNPVKYRVLSKSTSDFGGNTMLLDCDTTLIKMVHAPKDRPEGYRYSWTDSDINKWLNGDDFLGDEDDPHGAFTLQERRAIAAGTKNQACATDGDGIPNLLGFASLDGEKIFLLDAVEATNTTYGYANNYEGDNDRRKSGKANRWWLRSPCILYNNEEDFKIAGNVNVQGSVYWNAVDFTDPGVSPAFNISLSSVIFSSAISGEAGSAGVEYKLSIKDTDLGADPGIVTRKGNTVTVPYSKVNGDPDQLSVVMTDGTWSDETGWSTGAEMKYYGKLDVNGNIGTDGFGTFELPEGFSLADGWNAYLVPENINDDYETDYAGAPAAFTIPKLDPVCDVPARLTATYGQTLADVTLNDPAGNTPGNTPGKWSWVDAGTTSVGDAGTNSFKADFIPDDTTNYNSTTNVDVSVSVGKADSAVTKVPAAKKLTYNGKAQELVTAGEAAGGTMYYALGDANGAAEKYTASIPAAKNAGTYYVRYKVVGDKNHNDSGVAGPVKAVISAVSIKDAKVVLKSAKIGYNGKNRKPVVKTIKGLTLKEGTDYTVSVKNSKGKVVKTYKAIGRYTLVIKGKGNYTGTTKAAYEIVKGTNPLNVNAKKKTYNVNYSNLKNKDQSINNGKIYDFKKKGAGKITYSLSSARKGAKSYKKYFAVNNKGNLTIKTGLKKDSYTVKIKVKAAGDKNYKAATKTVTFTVKVK